MDVSAFLASLESVLDESPAGIVSPKDPFFVAVTDAVAGYTSANELAVLNLAARLMPTDEVYLEVGTYKGRSLCGAVHQITDKDFYFSENYLEFGMLGAQAQAELWDNLKTYAGHARVTFLEGDCFWTLTQPGVVRKPVGVYFYDGKHTKLAHYLALGLVEPLLADEALVLVDDATWPVVQAAHRAYFAAHPGWEVVQRWDATVTHDPQWANGLHALRYRRPTDRRIGLTADVAWRRRAQIGVIGPAESLAWHALHRFPRLVPLAAKLYPSTPSEITTRD